jgi:hypothetical protein
MNYLLFGGTHNVGKSETIWRITQNLRNRRFTIVAGSIPTLPIPLPPIPFPDFKVVLQGTDRTGKTINVLINSPTDDPTKIKELRDFLDSLNFSVDILISSIRDANSWPRQCFEIAFPINPPVDFRLEIPLAKIIRQRADFQAALTWYQQTIDLLVKHILSRDPFNIF